MCPRNYTEFKSSILITKLLKRGKVYALKPNDQVARTNFAVDMIERTDASPDFLQVCFSVEVTIHANGVVNRFNCTVWGSKNPHVTCELETGSPKVNVWAGLARQVD
jgi:hypothetical protein